MRLSSCVSAVLLCCAAVLPLSHAGAQASANMTPSDADVRTTLKSAFDAVMKCADPLSRIDLLCQIACYQKQVGDDLGAAATLSSGAALLKADNKLAHKKSVMLPYAVAQGQVESFQAENKTLLDMVTASDTSFQDLVELPTRVIPDLVKTHRADTAETLIRRIVDGYEQHMCLISLAGAYAAADDHVSAAGAIARAKRIASSMKTGPESDELMRTTAIAQANIASAADAEQTAASISDVKDRDEVFVAIAAMEARKGRVPEALRYCQSIKDVPSRQSALALVSIIRAEAGDTTQATEVAVTITDALAFVSAFARLARELHGSGKTEEAKSALEKAVAATSGVHDPLNRARALIKVGVARNVCGDVSATDALQQAGRCLENLKIDDDLFVTSTSLGVAYARLGQAEVGLKLMSQLSRSRNDIDTVCKIALVCAQRGNYQAAHELVRLPKLPGAEDGRLYAVKLMNQLQAVRGNASDAGAWTLTLGSPANQAAGLIGIAEGLMDRLHPGKRIALSPFERFDLSDDDQEADPSSALLMYGIKLSTR